jgi:tRNA-dihydrouridine synthase
MKNFWKNLKKPITLLAPMDDITDFVFREIISDIAKPDVLRVRKKLWKI